MASEVGLAVADLEVRVATCMGLCGGRTQMCPCTLMRWAAQGGQAADLRLWEAWAQMDTHQGYLMRRARQPAAGAVGMGAMGDGELEYPAAAAAAMAAAS